MIKKKGKGIKEHETATETDAIKKKAGVFLSKFSSFEDNHVKVHLYRSFFLFVSILHEGIDTLIFKNTHFLFYFFLPHVDKSLPKTRFSQCTGRDLLTAGRRREGRAGAWREVWAKG